MTTLGSVTESNVFDHLLHFHLVIHWCYPVEQFLPVLIHRLWCVDLVSAQNTCSKEGKVNKGAKNLQAYLPGSTDMQCMACTRSAGQVSSDMLHAKCCRTCNSCKVVLASPLDRRKVRHACNVEGGGAEVVNDKCLN